MPESRMVQAAACLGCGRAWVMPDDLPEEFKREFPLEPGVWKNPCPVCEGTIWLTDPITRAAFEEYVLSLAGAAIPDPRKLPQVFWFGSLVRLTFRCWALGHRWGEWRAQPVAEGFPEWVTRSLDATEHRRCRRRGCKRVQYRELERVDG